MNTDNRKDAPEGASIASRVDAILAQLLAVYIAHARKEHRETMQRELIEPFRQKLIDLFSEDAT